MVCVVGAVTGYHGLVLVLDDGDGVCSMWQ